jgi:Glu-tRNA(Gln) amidotransferase subunit E-like FAD-binding protein
MPKKRPDITESLFYDKYYVIKKSRAMMLAQEAVKQLSEEMPPTDGPIEVTDILERMCDIQGKQYFCLNLDEEHSLKAMQTYYTTKYDRDAAEACIEYIMKKELGRELVFKGKCLTRGKVSDTWHHPDGGKVFEIRDKDGNVYTVPESWVVKWLDAEPAGRSSQGNKG